MRWSNGGETGLIVSWGEADIPVLLTNSSLPVLSRNPSVPQSALGAVSWALDNDHWSHRPIGTTTRGPIAGVTSTARYDHTDARALTGSRRS